jgi:dihydrofolate reductase
MSLLNSSDTILIGRKLAVDYIPYWQDVYTKPNDPMYEGAERIVNARKVVFTKTLNSDEKEVTDWKNTELAKGNLADEIKILKSEKGKDIIVYGGSSFVSALLKENLIDELYLFVNPIALGCGDSIFYELKDWQHLKLIKSIAYPSGIVMLNYELK